MPEPIRGAIVNSRVLMRWLRPEADEVVTIRAMVAKVHKLLEVDFGFRGITFNDNCRDCSATVRRLAVIETLVAALLSLRDTVTGDAEFDCAAKHEGATVEIVIASDGQHGSVDLPPPPCRRLHENDVLALAGAGHISCAATRGLIRLRIPAISR